MFRVPIRPGGLRTGGNPTDRSRPDGQHVAAQRGEASRPRSPPASGPATAAVHATLCRLTRRAADGSPTWNRWRRYPRLWRAHTSHGHVASIGSSLGGVAGGLDVDLARDCQRRAVAAEAGLHHAVELIDAEGDRPRRGSPGRRPPSGSAGGRRAGARPPRRGPGASRLRLPHRQPADGVAVEVEVDGAPRALGAQHLVGAALDDPEQRLVGPTVGGAGHARPTRRCARRRAGRRRAGSAAAGTRRAPSGCRRRAAPARRPRDSGVNRCSDPSYVLRNVTPSSSTVGSSENTWKPPESVRVSPSQPANRPRPPKRATTSAPGRSIRW